MARDPTRADADALLAFLPAFEAPGRSWFAPEQPSSWGPLYADDVLAFFGALEVWMDPSYEPRAAWQMLSDDEQVARADLPALRRMLTDCARCERFCDGAQADLLARGRVQALLRRLAVLREGLS